WRIGIAGADRVHGDAAPGIFQRQRTGQANDAVLGRDIGRDVSVAGEARGRSHVDRSEEHTSELQSRENLVCRLLLEKKNQHALSLYRKLQILTSHYWFGSG